MSAEGNVRVAIGQALHADWVATNAAGYDPNLAASNANHLDIHLGWYDEDLSFPQLALTDISSAAQGANGYVAWKPDGSGHVAGYDGRIDATVFVGSAQDVPDGTTPALLADTIAAEVRRIAHANEGGLPDAATGARLLDRLAATSRPTGAVNTDYTPTRHTSQVELSYTVYEQPP